MPTVFAIALPVPLAKSFDYLAPEGCPDITPGTRVLVSFGKSSRQLVGVVLEKKTLQQPPKHNLKTITQVLDSTPLIDPELLQLCTWASRYYHHPIGETLATALPQKIRQANAVALAANHVWQLTPQAKGLAPTSLKSARKQRQALDLLIANGGQLTDVALKQQGVKSTILKALAEKSLIEKTTQAPAKPYAAPASRPSPYALTEEQQAAIEQLATKGFQASLIEGATGSGKTEIYLQMIAKIIERGQQALVLIPEISLSPQTIARFQQRFNAQVVALHSNLNDSERGQHWLMAQAGHADIVIGTRSAVFTPLPKLGLIVIDEEHDLSFKQQDGLRYSARDLALVRAQSLQIPIILGSATPSLESLNNALCGRYRHILLHQRPGSAQHASTELYDIRQQALLEGFSEHSLTQIQETLDRHQQVLVFINRRGYAPNLLCHHCGWQAQCKHCDSNLTAHQNPPHLRCHHCDYQRPPLRQCPECFSRELIHLGVGTEKIEQFLQNRVGDHPVIRIDRDSTQRKNGLEQLLKPVYAGEPCILVGTQMLVKGHHFPKVTLVVVPDADAGLFGSDFRASERTGQMLLQVAGRAGRADLPGKVLIQTHHVDHPLFAALFHQGYRAFADLLLHERHLAAMPPYTYLAIIRAESIHPRQAQDFLTEIRRYLDATNPSSVDNEYLGPMPALLERVNQRYRYFIQIKCTQRKTLHHYLTLICQHVEQLKTPEALRWSLDIDPLEIP